MNRILRIALFAAAGLAVLLVLGLGAALVFINPNDFKPGIEAMVLKATGKPLSLQGELSLSVFPDLEVKAGPAELHDNDSFGPDPFVRVEKFSASVAVMPLLSGRAEIDAVNISGVRIKLAIDKDGKANWTMPGKTGTSPQDAPKDSGTKAASPDLSALALDSLVIADAAVTYTDMRSGESARISVPELTIDSLRIGQKTTLNLEAACADVLPQPVALALRASFILPASVDQGLPFNAEGTLDATPYSFKGVFALPQTSRAQLVSLKGEIAVGDLDVDRYLPAGNRGKTASATGKKPDGKPEANQDETVRQFLNNAILDLYITVKSVTAAKIPIRDIKAGIKTDQGVLTVKPVTMTLADGPVTTEATLDARGTDIRSRLTGDWKQAKIGDLLRAATGKTPATGNLDASWTLNATGTAWPSAAKTLNGKLAANFGNGTIPAFKLIPSGIPNLPAKTIDLTNVRASGTWNVAKGIAQNSDLLVQAAGLKATGGGQINIPTETLHYTISVDLPTFPELPSLTVLPVVISGPLASPSYGIDQPKLLRDTAKSLINPAAKTGQELNKVGDKLGRLLSR